MSTTKNFIKSLLYDLAIFAMILSLVFRFGVGMSHVASGSMEGSILTGDRVILVPSFYGGKTPQTPLALPFWGQPTLFGFRTYRSWIQLPVARAPGYQPKKGDAVTFEPTINHDDTNASLQKDRDAKDQPPPDTKVPFCKRIVATAGDRVKIVDGKVYVNGASYDPNAQYRQYYYEVKVQSKINFDWLDHNTQEWKYISGGEEGHTYGLTMTLAQKTSLENYLQTQDIKITGDIKFAPHTRKPTKGDAAIGNDMEEVKAPYHRWNAKQKTWESLTIELNKDTHALYIATLENTVRDFYAEEKGGEKRFYIKGKQIHKYTFKENHFLPMGDNFHFSVDGRSFGFVPYKNLNAKICYVFCNLKTGWNGKGWRFFHKIAAPGDTDVSGWFLFFVFFLSLIAIIGGAWFSARKRE